MFFIFRHRANVAKDGAKILTNLRRESFSSSLLGNILRRYAVVGVRNWDCPWLVTIPQPH
jgi:hypothetical protein